LCYSDVGAAMGLRYLPGAEGSHMGKLLRWISEAFGHISNAWTIAGWLGWTTPIIGFGAWALTFFTSALEGWSPTGVWLGSPRKSPPPPQRGKSGSAVKAYARES
jgi:hypothetical protein